MGRNRKTHEKFLEEVKELVGDEYTVLGKYITNQTSVQLKHNTCGNLYSPKPNDFLRGKRCFKCFGVKKKTPASFRDEVRNIYGNEYEVLGDYTNNATKIIFMHNVCGKEYTTTPYNFLRQKRCPECTFKYKKDTEYFKREVASLVGTEYVVTGDYKTTSTKLLMHHTTCGSDFKATPHSFLKGTRCPICNSSKGEEAIRQTLTKLKIQYEQEYTFAECTHKKRLRFDFALFKEGELLALLEFDGKQHFEPIEFWGGKSHFSNVKSRDAKKENFCIKEGIPLFRIPYWYLNDIPDILEYKIIPSLT